MPLTDKVSFETRLQKGNRIQVPKLVRWRYKLESKQILIVSLHATGYWGDYGVFYSRMDKSGRINVPKLTLTIMRNPMREKRELVGAIMKVTVTPA